MTEFNPAASHIACVPDIQHELDMSCWFKLGEKPQHQQQLEMRCADRLQFAQGHRCSQRLALMTALATRHRQRLATPLPARLYAYQVTSNAPCSLSPPRLGEHNCCARSTDFARSLRDSAERAAVWRCLRNMPLLPPPPPPYPHLRPGISPCCRVKRSLIMRQTGDSYYS